MTDGAHGMDRIEAARAWRVDRPLTFETMLSDPLIRLVMDSDRVSLRELVRVLEVAGASVMDRERKAAHRGLVAAEGE